MSKSKLELLHTQTNAGEALNSKYNSEELVTRVQVEGTPYWIIGNGADGYRLFFGKYILTEYFSNVDNAKKHLDDNTLNVVLQTILCVVTEGVEGIKRNEGLENLKNL